MTNKLVTLALVALAMASCHLRPENPQTETDELGFNTKQKVDTVFLDKIKIGILTGEFDGQGIEQDSLLRFMVSMDTWNALPEAMPYFVTLADKGTSPACGWIYDALKHSKKLDDGRYSQFAVKYLEKGVELDNYGCKRRLAELTGNAEGKKGGKK